MAIPKMQHLDSAAFPQTSQIPAESLSYIARLKRFHEIWLMDSRLRDSFTKSQYHTLLRELDIDSKDALALTGLDLAQSGSPQNLVYYNNFWREL